MIHLKHLLPLLSLLYFILPSPAKEISPEEALTRAMSQSSALMTKGTGKVTTSLAHTTLTEKGEPALYIFNKNNEGGFLILSADDATSPILGYSDNCNFSYSEIPPQMEWWLAEYARQIDFARKHDLPSFSSRRYVSRDANRTPISPMLKTMWDQVAPFNYQCPLDGTDRAWTGCVATAMAQVMNYWEYPEKGSGQITYTIESLGKKVTMDFSKKKFDWGNMLDKYIAGHYTEENADAVAYLMKACGYAVKMQYSMSASGALAMNIGNALTKYFNYDPNLQYTLRQYYSPGEWEEMIYQNLKDIGPILYGGASTLGGGHSFVCDGYDGNGMFHFNWGWSGMSDGYFSLDALNPDALGAGGGTGGGYNFTQDAVFGIQPPTGLPVEHRSPFLTQRGELSGKISGETLELSLLNSGQPMWVNYNPTTLYVKFGAMFYPQEDMEGNPIYHDISKSRFELQPGYGIDTEILKPTVNLSELNLSNGTYKVVVGSVEVSENSDSDSSYCDGFTAIKASYGCADFIMLKVADGKYTVINDLLPPLKIQGEIIGGVYYGCLTKVKITVENPSDIERISGFAPVFMDHNGPLLLGESILITIPPKTKVTREWDTDLQQLEQYMDPYFGQNLIFTFFNEESYDFYTDSFSQIVTFNANPGVPKLTVTKPLSILNSNHDGTLSIINDSMNIETTAQLTLTSGMFRYPVVVCLYEPAENGQVHILATAVENVFLSADSDQSNVADINLSMSYPLYAPDKTYYVTLTYSSPDGLIGLTDPIAIKFADPSGINGVEEDQDPFSLSIDRQEMCATITAIAPIHSVETYDITGKKIDRGVSINDNCARISIGLQGIILLKVTDSEGNYKIYKLK